LHCLLAGRYLCLLLLFNGFLLSPLSSSCDINYPTYPSFINTVKCISPQKPVVTANGPLSLCSGGSVTLTATLGRSYKWSNGSKSQSITVSQGNKYTVEVEDFNGCFETSNEVIVNVSSRLKSPRIEYTGSLVSCKDGNVEMTVAEQEGASYVWKRDGVIVASGTNKFIAQSSGVYMVELSNFCGSVRSVNQLVLNVQEEALSPEVTVRGSLIFCEGGAVELAVQQLDNVIYSWFKNGVKINASEFSFIARESGMYKAMITNTCGNYSTNEVKVEVLSLPPVPKVEVEVIDVCSGDSGVTLSASGGIAGNYLWYTVPKGGQAIAGVSESIYTTGPLLASTIYYVAITNGKCESERVPVRVEIKTQPAAPIIMATGNTSFCKGGSVMLQPTILPDDVEYLWFRNMKLFVEGNQELEATEDGDYSLVLKNKCGNSIISNSIKINVWPIPDKPVVIGGSTCGAGMVKLVVKGSNSAKYRWFESMSANTPITGVSDGIYETPVLSSSRSYFVTAIDGDCESERVEVVANVYPEPLAIANTDLSEIDAGESVLLTGSGGDSYKWSPTNGLATPASKITVARPDATTRYTLTVTNKEGCSDTTSVVVMVRKSLVIPNAFSPNGDGVNDTWSILNIEYFQDSKVEVYSRWGNLVYERINYQNDWDGTYRGAALPSGAYLYVIQVPGKAKHAGYLNIVR
jgi:gliding motility-associated-like protein